MKTPTSKNQTSQTGQRVTLNLDQISVMEDLQTRVRLDQECIDDYAKAMKDGAEFPPVDVFKEGDIYMLVDGFHRHAARIKSGLKKQIEAFIHEGGFEDALKFALSTNATNGLRRTNSDKHRAVKLALGRWPNLSDRKLSDICAVSNTFVGEFRKQVSTVDTSAKRVGKDGKKYPAKKCPPPPTKKTSMPQQPPKKAKSEDVLKDYTGLPVPKEIEELWRQADEQPRPLLDNLKTVRDALGQVKEEQNLIYAEVNLDDAIAKLGQVITDLKLALPYAVCTSCQGKGGLEKDCLLCKGKGFLSKFRWDTALSDETKNMRTKKQKS